MEIEFTWLLFLEREEVQNSKWFKHIFYIRIQFLNNDKIQIGKQFFYVLLNAEEMHTHRTY